MLIYFLSISIYFLTPSGVLLAGIYFVHSGLQDESLQVTIFKLPQGVTSSQRMRIEPWTSSTRGKCANHWIYHPSFNLTFPKLFQEYHQSIKHKGDNHVIHMWQSHTFCLPFVLDSRYVLQLFSCFLYFYIPDFYGDLVYKLKKIVGSNNFSAQFIKIISHYKRLAITLMYCNRLHAWLSTQSRLATLLSSLIARRWVGLQTL